MRHKSQICGILKIEDLATKLIASLLNRRKNTINALTQN